jgi:hypothetical protein
MPANEAAGPPRLAMTCPSGPPEPGSALLGVVVAPGQVAYLTPPLPVTQEMLDGFTRDGVPVENRMRFSCACQEHRCQQWGEGEGGGRCTLADRAIAALAITEGPGVLPRCGIRATCRWFAQHRAKACAACPEVIRRPA